MNTRVNCETFQTQTRPAKPPPLQNSDTLSTPNIKQYKLWIYHFYKHWSV